jgi:hypothetical protein
MPMDNRDPCDAFLDGGGLHPVNPELRQTLLQRTTGVLRWRRLRRRLALVAGLAACYLAGAATTRLLAPLPRGEVRDIARQSPAPQQPVAPPLPAPAPVARAPEIDAQLPPAVLEQLGEQAGKERRTAYYRLAGERYEKVGDMQAALRCYRLAVDSASEADLVISSTDSFLLMALKSARCPRWLGGRWSGSGYSVRPWQPMR